MPACRPDVFGVKEDGAEEVLVEVETSNSFTEKHAEHQRDTFVAWAKARVARRAYLCVPKDVLLEAALKLGGYDDVWSF